MCLRCARARVGAFARFRAEALEALLAAEAHTLPAVRQAAVQARLMRVNPT